MAVFVCAFLAGSTVASGSVPVGPWTQQQEFTSQPAPAAAGAFGTTIVEDAAGDTALVSDYYATVGANDQQGAVNVYTRSGSTWSQQARLTASDGASEDLFGGSIAISPDGRTVLIGAPGRQRVGAAYVFTRSGNQWTQQAELAEPDGSAFDGFGDSVAIAGGTALVGVSLLQSGPHAADGAVYVFTGAGSTWTMQTTLSTGVQFDNFGLSVALSAAGDTALIGAQAASRGPGAGPGAAYVFTGSGANWTQQAKLTAGDGALGDTFGRTISLSASGDQALIGAPLHAVGAAAQQGAAYMFTRTGGKWSQQQELTAPDGSASDELGSALALSGDGASAMIGSPRRDGFRGGAYAFSHTGSGWVDDGTVLASDAAANDELGTAVGLDSSGQVALLGAQNKGVIYAFGLTGGPPRIIASGAVSSQPTSIDVAATIIPDGLSTHYHVEWGPTTAYGQSGPDLPQTGALTGFSAQDALAEMTGLAPHTTYHWRIVASNSAGTVDGPVHTDRTQPKAWIPHATVPPSGHTELPVPVSSVGSIAGSDPVANYDWDFSGNGTYGLVCPASMPIAYHTYSRPGRYTVTLKITTVTGQTSIARQQITVVGRNGGTVIGGPPANNGGGACASVGNGGGSCIRIVDWGLIHAEIDDGGCFEISKPLRATPVTNCVVCPTPALASSQQEAYVGADWWSRFDRANGMVYSTLHPVNMNGLIYAPQDVGQKVSGVDKNRFVIDQADNYVYAPNVDITITHSRLQIGSHEAISKFFPPVAPSIIGVNKARDRRIARSASAPSGFDNPCDDPDINQAPLLAQIGNHLPHAVPIDGFGIKGAIDVHVVGGETVMCANAQLPLFTSPPPDAQPLTVHATLVSDSATGLHLDNLHATLDDGYLGLVHFSNLEFTYSRVNARWEAAATMEILPGFSVSIDMAFETGNFRHGALGVDFPDPGFPIGDSGVFLTHIDGSVDNPAGGPLQVTANVRLGAEPDLAGIGYLLTIDGGAGVTFGDTPTVHVTGDARLIGVTLANGDLTVSGNGSFSFHAHIDQRLFGVMGVVSDFSGGYWPTLKFNVEGDASLSVLDFVSIGGNFLVSSKGVAGCVALKSGPFHLHVGAGGTYSPFDVNLMFSSCDAGPWRVSGARDTKGHAAATGVLVSRGTPYEVIAVDGTTAPPAVTVRGPDRRAILAPAVGHILTSQYLITHDPAGKTTFVVIRAPQPGPWTITPSPGSAPIRRIRSAVSLPDPSVRARVGGSGWARTLTYRVRQIAGQTVTFIEAGRKTVGAIGTARGARGRVRFTPAAGPAGVRSVVAIVSENGIPRARIVVAHYRAPGPRRPARPSHLTVRRRGTTLLVSWRRVTAATRYSVYVRISDGRRLLRLVTTSRLRIPEVGTTRIANVTVTAFDNARPGAAATKTIRPVAKRPKRPGRKHPKR